MRPATFPGRRGWAIPPRRRGLVAAAQRGFAIQDQQITFSFGKNWKAFVDQHFSEERVRISKEHLLGFLELPDLRGKYFLDVGSGSGLSSLAAFDAGAARIVSFDVDPHSVETTRRLRAMRGDPSHWEVLHGSVLDEAFLATIDPADIVYSWGVLHHTGKMWQAVENASKRMKPDGCFYVALYTTSPKSGYWLEVKKRYNVASPLRKRMMEGAYVFRNAILPSLLARKSPLTYIRGSQRSRGMAYLVDVRDWLGGYPYEDAKIEEVLAFGRQRLGLELTKIATGEAYTEYLFSRRR